MEVCISVEGYEAIQLMSKSGLLCVTCTDLSVLATTNYPEKWYVRSVAYLIQ